MSKIKKIEISDFRIYEGTEVFNLENKDNIANLVALYAPNGYGKTSFFDAIEWTFSDEIKRFKTPFITKAINDETKDTILLTNTESYKSGIEGKTKIFLDNNSFIGKLVNSRQKRNSDYRNDYRKGEPIEGSLNPEDKEVNKIPETNVLTQDQIDSFLRFKTPEQKFEALKEFWPQSFGATERLKQLSDIYKKLNKKIDSLVNSINENKESLAELNGNEENIFKVNVWLDKFKKVDYTNFTKYTIEKIDNSISKEDFEKIHEENSRNTKQLQLEIENLETKKVNIEFLIRDVENYITSTSKLKSLEVSIKQLQTRKSNYLNLRKSKEFEGQLLKELEILKEQIVDYNYLLDKLNNYLLDIEKANQLKSNDESLLNANYKLLDYKKNVQNSIINFKNCLQKHSSILSEKKSKERDLQKVFTEFQTTNEKLQNNRKELIEFKEYFQQNSVKIDSLQKSAQSYSLIIEKKDYSNELLLDGIVAKEVLTELQKLSNNLIEKNGILVCEKEELNKLLRFNDDLDKVIFYGKDYLIKTESSDCPLCKTPFESFKDILSKIDLEKLGALNIAEQQTKVDSIYKEIDNLTSKIDEAEKSIISKINFERGKILDEISALQEIKDKRATEIIDCEKSIATLSFDIDNHILFFKEVYPNLLNLDNDSFKIVEQNIKEEIINLTQKEDRLKNILEKKEIQLKNLEIQLTKNSSIKETNRNRIESIENQEYLNKYNNLISFHSIDKSLLNNDYLTEKIKDLVQKKSEKQSESDNISLKIKDLYESLDSEDLKVSETEIDGEINNLESEKKLSVDFIEKYTQLFNKYLSDQNFSKDSISQFLLQTTTYLDKLINLKNELNTFGIDLELIKENVRVNELLDEIRELENEIPALDRSLEKIFSARNDCMAYIENGINSYFNKDVINLIYGRIEPHPKLSTIDFKTDFNNNGEPRLLITTGNDEGQVNPILFLSAGQVNVLSLSIFLARCFEYGNKEIETIFMDDPIQNLSDINVLSFIDLLRSLITTHNKQIVISTHDEKFFRLLQNKLPEEYCSAKYFEYESMGKLKNVLDKEDIDIKEAKERNE
ncbi:AAA family ATPase [Myroides odoratimimus]|uniref:AAA family ATPase n=1 Tax=Myroides odoratimimus TaxID=76832 RepID=UPI002577AC7D|nr:AAA family ATPase [Myroides odoratimimus]MDM1328670.1 AAA family ATPase [Myroides odoratimimus]